MNGFFRFFAERHILANVVTLMTILLGISTLFHIRRDVWPEIDMGQVIVTTRYPGASPEDVELNVTNKIEKELKSVSGIERTSSVSMENISVINIVIDSDARDQAEIESEIEEAVGRVTDFPVEVTESPLLTKVKTSEFPIIEVGLAGDVPYRELREYAKLFEKKLEMIAGVGGIQKYGYLSREIKVEVSPDAMHEYQIPLREIITAIGARNIRQTGGSFESYTSEKNLVTLAQFRDPLEVKEVIVRSSFDGPLIQVKDLAIIRDDFEDQRIISRINGKPAISFLINKKETGDVIRAVQAIKNLAAAEAENLPPGIEFLYSTDFSKYVSNRLDVVLSNGVIGLILVVILLSIFLGIRSAFWVAMGIPVTLLGVVFFMPIFDIYLDVLSLAAMIIVIGIIVDDGIIIAENIQRHREQGAPALKAAVDGISEVFLPVATTILTTFLAFAPMFFMTGMMGDFIYVMPLVISMALFISLFEVTVALPAHLTRGMVNGSKKSPKPPRTNWFEYISNPCANALVKILRWRYLAVFFFAGLFAATIWYSMNYMQFTLFPSSMADKVYILIELPTGSSLQATSDKVKELEEIIGSLPESELESFTTRIGTQEVFIASGFPPGENENWAFIIMNLSPYQLRDRTADVIVEGLRSKADMLEGFERVVFSVDAGGPPVGKPVTLRVVGANDQLRSRLADSVMAFMSAQPGLKDVDRDDKLGKDQIEIDIDYRKLSRLGLTVADLAQNVRIAYDGEMVTSVRYGDEDVDFRVQLQEQARSRPEYLRELQIPNRQGRLVRLKEAAELKTSPGQSNYFHYNRDRTVTITADIDKDVTTSLAATQQVVDNFDLGQDWPGMRFVIGGEAEETEKSMESLARAFVLAIIGIYFLLILLFNSPTQPLIVLSAVPFGFMGVIVAFAFHGEELGFMAMLGVIGLVGVLVNDSLVLVNHINRLRRKSPSERILKLIAQGTHDRLRAVILTSLTTVAGLMPLAYGLGGADAWMAPMSLALAYGLLFATPITLILVPCLYAIRQDIKSLFRRSK